jgi:thymidylate synthase (FAD)
MTERDLGDLGIKVETKEGFLPVIDSEVYYTEKGTPYLKRPGVALIAVPHVDLRGLEGFLSGFPPEYGFIKYLSDPTPLPPAEELCKTAGQTCYMSFGPERTMNKDASRYFFNTISSGHGSILEHANFTFLIYGAPRSFTHELVRHRAGMGYSQVSQRYVSGKVLRFVESVEYQDDERLHGRFTNWIDGAVEEYETRARLLLEKQRGGAQVLQGESKTDLRKKVQQVARDCLPNETEAPIVVTGNVRAWRHIINMRASEHADTKIRKVAFDIFRCLRTVSPLLFGDFEVVHLSDGTHGVRTEFPKV